MQDVVIFLAIIVIGGWFAGTINPAVVGMAGKHRWKVFVIGFVISLLAVMSTSLFEPTGSISTSASLFGLFSMMISCGWSIWALIALWRKRNKHKARSGSKTKPWESSKPQLLTKEQRKSLELPSATPAKPIPSIPIIQPTKSRATRTGWKLGTVTFSYEDAEGEITSRTVTVHSVNSLHLKGECHTRRAERTFRIDRILGDVVDIETGEIIRPKALARHFA